MIVYVIRHAWAGKCGDPEWPDDSQRPLTEKGRRRFAKMVAKLAEREFAPGIVATSPLVRCRQTAELLVKGLPKKTELLELEALLPGSNLEALLEWTAAQSDKHEAVAWVGHSPDVEHLMAELLGGAGLGIRFAKGAVAAVSFDETPAAGQGELQWLATAKLLRC